MTISTSGAVTIGGVSIPVTVLVGPNDTEQTAPALLYGVERKRMAFSDGTGKILDLTQSAGGSDTWGAITGNLSDQTDLSAALAAKAPLASPALTGSPTAPTQTALDDSTKIATTAYADTADALHALKTQVFSAPIFIGTVVDGVLYNMRMTFACTLTDIYVKTSSGTTSVQAKKNGSNVGSANSASSVEAHQGSIATAFADGDYLEFDAASTSSALNLVVVGKFTRSLA